jgi:CheY-like chemotaxis protein/DNA-directed RNA polymerase specialized sigma24 family protein
MPDASEKIVENLPYLRRYARALLGSQQAGDTYVRICLEALLQEPERVAEGEDIRRALFRLFHDVWSRAGTHEEAGEAQPGNLSVEARLQALPTSERQILLLTALEGFSVHDASYVLDLSHEAGSELLASAWSSVNEQTATSILVIEDEPVIALDIVGLVRDMGHAVIGIAASQSEAVRLAQKTQPGLVLADIDLGPGGSGLTAVKEILESMKVPVIFVTAYPERLLTGERPEPTYLVTKPFEPDTLKVTISQALSFFGQRQSKQAV